MYKFVLIIALLFVSCSYTDKEPASEKLISSFEEINVLIGLPGSMSVYGDYLIIDNWTDDGKLLELVDINSGTSVRRCINRGDGPADLLDPIDFKVRGDSLLCLSRRVSKFKMYSIPNLLSSDSLMCNPMDFGRFDRFTSSTKGYFFFGPGKADGLSIYNSTGNFVNTLPLFSEYDDKLKNESLMYRMKQGFFDVSDDGRYLAFGGSFLGVLKFYEINADGSYGLIQNIEFDHRMQDKIMDKGENVVIDQSDLDHCWDVQYFNGAFYVQYNGLPMSDTSSMSSILKYSEDGQLQACYKFRFPLVSFCMKDENSAFGISKNNDGDYILVRFSL